MHVLLSLDHGDELFELRRVKHSAVIPTCLLPCAANLRSRRGRRAAEQRDELAAPQLKSPPRGVKRAVTNCW